MIDTNSNQIVSDIVNWSEKQRIKFIVTSTLFISLIHIIFKPFQLAHYPLNQFVKVNICYFIITTICLFTFYFLLPKYWHSLYVKMLKTSNGRILYLSASIFCIGLGFFIFKVTAGYYPFTFDRIITGLLAIIAIGAIPFIMWYKIDRTTNNKEDTFQITSTRIVKLDQILYIESSKNYVIWYYIENEQVQSIKVRSSLKKVLDELDNRELVKCHKAFIINKSKIEKLYRKNNSFEANLNDLNIKIPVSRSYRKNLS